MKRDNNFIVSHKTENGGAVKRWLLDYSGQPQKSNQNPHTHKINQKSSLLQKPQNQELVSGILGV